VEFLVFLYNPRLQTNMPVAAVVLREDDEVRRVFGELERHWIEGSGDRVQRSVEGLLRKLRVEPMMVHELYVFMSKFVSGRDVLAHELVVVNDSTTLDIVAYHNRREVGIYLLPSKIHPCTAYETTLRKLAKEHGNVRCVVLLPGTEMDLELYKKRRCIA